MKEIKENMSEKSGPGGPENTQKRGVLSSRIEKNYYIVEVRWKDDQLSEVHFPENGFEVVNPQNNKHLGTLKGQKALQILEKHAGNYTREEFSWRDWL